MTTKKLLAGVALAALLSGGALAQTVTVDGAGNFDGGVVPLELDGPLTGTAILDFALDDVFVSVGAGGVVQATFTLTNATFDGPVAAGAWTPATDANCNFGQPTLGGGAGGSSISFNSQSDTRLCGDATAAVDPNANDGTISLPISITDPDLPVTISHQFTATVDAGTYGGASGSSTIYSASDFLGGAIVAGAAGTGGFNAAGTTLEGSGVIGSFNLGVFSGLVTDLTAALADAVPTPAAGDIATGGVLTVTFPSGTTGLGAIALSSAPAVVCAGPVAGVFTCPLALANINAIDGGAAGDTITIVSDGNPLTSVTPQTPTASLAVTAAAGYTIGAVSGPLAPIDLNDGVSVTPIGTSNFAWVRIGSGGTESNFRMSFASPAAAAAVTEVRVAVAPGNGITGGTATLLPGADVATNFRIQGSTITFNSAAIGAALGETGNANVTSISVQHDDVTLTPGVAAGVTPLRQLVNRSPGSFVATPGLESDN